MQPGKEKAQGGSYPCIPKGKVQKKKTTEGEGKGDRGSVFSMTKPEAQTETQEVPFKLQETLFLPCG